ncbi:ABC transporter substrate-binding protein [Corynebacterium liangguodongii]|uniref:Putative aliphatic sulfonates-binding protein n=1 Tax=Corynebacterium liangguodongii TaxID=2079535 RepID=A0A2S0WGK0_9CORY|nr:ABC transporter substrate-binding protein [Corynebacterium liangguodongii]AWB84918.1 ABC transporter substrate-binding protein [Corynebacterium liangguodongii]PWB99374.1 ABC transporter substrate-binding protein [Corynebacterium liangguodongii]
MSRSTTILTAVVAALALGLGACSSAPGDGAASGTSPQEVDLSKVTLKVGDQVAGTEEILRAAGRLEDSPYTIEWSSFTSGPPQIEALNAGQIDFAITGNTPPVIGGPTKTKVVSAYGDNGVGEAILVPAGSPVASVADLKGKKIAVARGSSAHGHVLMQLKKEGLSTSDVELNFLQPADAKGAFENGQVDAWAVWDPFSSLAEIQGAKPVARATGVTGSYNFGVASDKALADRQKEAALADFLARVSEAYEWGSAHPEEWAQAYAQASGFDPQAAKLHTRSLRLPIALDDDVNGKQNELIDAFASDNLIKAFDFSTIVDRRFEK